MRIGITNFRRVAWLACFAVLLNALAPTVSHGLSSWRTSDHGLIEVCTSFGIELIPAESSDNTPVKAPKKGTAAGCAFCAAHAGSFALPLEAPQTAAAATPGAEPLTLALYARPRGLPWTVPQSRAPPRHV